MMLQKKRPVLKYIEIHIQNHPKVFQLSLLVYSVSVPYTKSLRPLVLMGAGLTSQLILDDLKISKVPYGKSMGNLWEIKWKSMGGVPMTRNQSNDLGFG